MRMLAVLTVAAVGFAGCTNGSTPSPSPSPTPPPVTSAASQVAACLVGTWQSTSVQGGAQVTGGSGVRLTIAPDGMATVDFTSMQPVTFAAQIAGSNVKGDFTYAGEVGSKIKTASPSATTGVWEPAGSVDWSKVRITLNLTEPVKAKPLDNLPIRDYLGDRSSQTGGVVDIDPLLGKGTYTCEGSTTLTLTPQNTSGLKWTLTRKT